MRIIHRFHRLCTPCFFCLPFDRLRKLGSKVEMILFECDFPRYAQKIALKEKAVPELDEGLPPAAKP